MKVYFCCICKKLCTGCGNNPWPVVKKKNARCCDVCNVTKVIPQRLFNLEEG